MLVWPFRVLCPKSNNRHRIYHGVTEHNGILREYLVQEILISGGTPMAIIPTASEGKTSDE